MQTPEAPLTLIDDEGTAALIGETVEKECSFQSLLDRGELGGAAKIEQDIVGNIQNIVWLLRGTFWSDSMEKLQDAIDPLCSRVLLGTSDAVVSERRECHNNIRYTLDNLHSVHFDYMSHHDMPEVLTIENQSFEFPWSEEDFIRVLRRRNCRHMVAEFDERIVGYMIYESHKMRLHVLNFAVHPDWRRHGVGTALIGKLINKLSLEQRNRILLEVCETNLPAQLFFRNAGFRAVSVLRDSYDDTTEDAYLMEYRLPLDDAVMWSGANRASQYFGG